MNRLQIIGAAACLIILFAATAGPGQAQSWIIKKNPSPALVGQLTKQLSITPTQATGGAGALFGFAKSRLSAAEFSKVAAAVPGMRGLLKAAPSTSPATGGLAGLAASLPEQAGGLATVAGSFQKLGLSPGMIEKFVPVLTQFVQARGGTNTASLLGKALQ